MKIPRPSDCDAFGPVLWHLLSRADPHPHIFSLIYSAMNIHKKIGVDFRLKRIKEDFERI